MSKFHGRVTVPTDADIINETLDIIKRWKADAIRDCDGTNMPKELAELDIKQYATYYTTRKDNAWAQANPKEIQQVYLMSDPITSTATSLSIDIMEHFYRQQLKPNNLDDITKYWEVIDRTSNQVVSPTLWSYDEETTTVHIKETIPYHSYTVTFLAFIIWDPVHMYNFITNDWQNEEHQMTYDVRQPKTQAYVLEKLEKYCQEHPEVDVIRFTTFFHQFTLVFNEHAKEKFVDWFGYSASVSPYILEQFEKEVGYPFRPEFIVNQGTHNSTFVVPTKEFSDFIKFQRREVAALIKKFVAICHKYNKEVMMFLGDHWIGTEPYGEYFKELGIDAVVGSVGNGTTLRLISEIEGLKYTEGRFLPYFFPDSFYPGANPIQEAKENWVTARRAILRKPIDRIGYGGYLKLALDFPEFIDYITSVTDEFRELYDNINNLKPYTMPFKVYILNAWGKLRAWQTHMTAHALTYKEYYSYSGVVEALSGMPFDIEFINFDDILNKPELLKQKGVILNIGEAYDAFSGGSNWDNPEVVAKIREYIANGNGFIGIGEPSAFYKSGKFFQLYDVLGVDKELGFTLSTDKYNWETHSHPLLDGFEDELDFGEEIKNNYALEGAKILKQKNRNINLAVNEYGKGKSVYFSGLPFSRVNSRLLYKAIFYAVGELDALHTWYSENPNVEVNVYPSSNKYCVVNNTYQPQTTTVYIDPNTSFTCELKESEIKWFDIQG